MKLYYEPSDELKHYGVVGMRWGMRKAQKQGTTYNYRSMGQKKYEKKLNKLTKKGASKDKISKVSKKLDIIKTRDKNRQDYAKKSNLGKSIVKTILMNPLGAGNYNRMRASGAGRIHSLLTSNVLSSTFGYPLTALYTRHREKKMAKKKDD